MALVDETPACRRALRRAASLAAAFRAPLLAVTVETPSVQQSRDLAADLRANVDFALDLGAEVIAAQTSDLARGLADVIAERRVEHLVLVRPPRRAVSLGPTLADRLMEASSTLEIHLVNPPLEPGR